jgi:hypothetical protein
VIWQNPLAWLGLGTIAIPILIHLLGRDRAPRHSFPSLRFIEIAELPPTRRTRLHDLLLLATRVAILGVAVAALAQPLLLLARRRATIDGRIARAIIVDTSASMSRPTPAGGHAVDSARSEAKRLASDARTSIVLETTSPTSAMEGAIRWLESQRSRRELVVVSDFQAGTLDSAAVSTVPEAIGVRAVAIPVQGGNALLERGFVARTSVVARVDFAHNATNVSWMLGALAGGPRVDIDAGDSPAIDAITSAAKIVGMAEPIDTATRVTVVFGDAPDHDALTRRATRVTSRRLIDLVARVRANSLLASTASVVGRGAVDSSLTRLGPVVISDAAGSAVAIAAEDTTAGVGRLLVFSNDVLGSIRSAALVGALRRALSMAPPAGELDPSAIPATVLASWQRAPSATPTRDNTDSANGPSDGRWLWVLVIALLVVESWLRRERRVEDVRIEERAHDRAA